MPVSGSAIRERPLAHWDYLPECVRPHFVRRVCLFGPEATGKSTLARDLAQHYQSVVVPEYARTLLEFQSGACSEADLEPIARGQLASEAALARRTMRVLFCDTDALTTCIWSQILFGHCSPTLEALSHRSRYELTLLLDVDVPWVPDESALLARPAPVVRRNLRVHAASTKPQLPRTPRLLGSAHAGR